MVGRQGNSPSLAPYLEQKLKAIASGSATVKSSIKCILFCTLNNEFLIGLMAFVKVLANFVKLTSHPAVEKPSEVNWIKEII